MTPVESFVIRFLTVIIVLGYAAGLYFQNKRLDDFRDGLYKYLDTKFKAVEDHLEKLEDFDE
jgi:hypothetical protein